MSEIERVPRDIQALLSESEIKNIKVEKNNEIKKFIKLILHQQSP